MAMSPIDNLREAIQAVLTAAGDGWTVGHFLVVTGIERLTADGLMESTVWMIVPSDQPDWMANGLLEAAWSMGETADIDDD